MSDEKTEYTISDLAKEFEITHLGCVERFLGRIGRADRGEQLLKPLLGHLVVRFVVPECVVGIEGNDFNIFHIGMTLVIYT